MKGKYKYLALAVPLFFTALFLDLWLGGEHERRVLHMAIRAVYPLWADPEYENFDRIKNGMTREDVHRLMGRPPTNFGPPSLQGTCYEEWHGTQGVISVGYSPWTNYNAVCSTNLRKTDRKRFQP